MTKHYSVHLRWSRSLLLAALSALLFAASGPALEPRALAQPPFPQGGSGFRPVDLWAAAVLAGDSAAIKRFYISSAKSSAQTAQGNILLGVDEETAFWAALRAQGLSGLNAKILQQDGSQPGVMQLVLRIELTFGDPQHAQGGLVSARQIWTKMGTDWLIVATRRSGLAAMPSISLPQPKIPNTHLYPDPAEAPQELKAAVASAKADHKRVLVIFGANWCYDCHVLDSTLRSKEVLPLIAANYHVIHVNIGDGDSNGDLADRFQVPLKKGIPSLAVLDSNGQLITSQKQGEFESAAKIGMGDVLEFLNRWKPSSR